MATARETSLSTGRDAQAEAHRRAEAVGPHSSSFSVLAVAVLGVVYGDIGTSPIYALRECFAGKNPLLVTHDNVLGILSLVFWTLLLVISLKYMVFVLQADNRGEGGTFALLALLRRDGEPSRRRRRFLEEIHYFIGHVDLLAGRRREGMARWRDRIFVFMASNTEDATTFHRIPAAQSMRVGLQVGI